MRECPTHHRLERHGVLRVEQAARLRAEDGTLWLTIDHEPEDIVLERGEDYLHDGRAVLLATPLGTPVRVSVWPVREAGGWASRFGPLATFVGALR